jgi:hypothetical protein
MLAGVDAFHTAVRAHDGSYPDGISDGCRWAINGEDTDSCTGQLGANRLQHLQRLRDVQLLAVDEARGLVVTSGFEDYPASPLEFTDSAGTKYRDAGSSPRTLRTVEVFRFEDGLLRRIEGFTLQLPYGMPRP